MKFVLFMLLMASNVTLMAQPLGPVIDLQTGQFKGFAQQEGKDIVILGPKGMMIIPDAAPSPARPATPTTPPSSSQAPQTPAPTSQGK
jgi:hypothetical protein